LIIILKPDYLIKEYLDSQVTYRELRLKIREAKYQNTYLNDYLLDLSRILYHYGCVDFNIDISVDKEFTSSGIDKILTIDNLIKLDISFKLKNIYFDFAINIYQGKKIDILTNIKKIKAISDFFVDNFKHSYYISSIESYLNTFCSENNFILCTKTYSHGIGKYPHEYFNFPAVNGVINHLIVDNTINCWKIKIFVRIFSYTMTIGFCT